MSIILPRHARAIGLTFLMLALVPHASATLTGLGNNATDAQIAVDAMVPPPGFVTAAAWTVFAGGGGAATPAAISDMPIAPAFGHAPFAILSTGDALDAADPQANNANTNFGTTANGGNDVTTLRIDVDLPVGNDCIAFTYTFLTEETAGVGAFNDGFVAELDLNTWSVAGGALTAPDAFATMTVNTAVLTAGDAAGSVYDLGTGPTANVLRAAVETPPGPHTLYLTVYDAGDNAWDTAVFVTNLRYGVMEPTIEGPDCFPPLYQSAQMVIARSAIGTHLVLQSGNFICQDMNTGAPVASGSALVGPNPGVSCTIAQFLPGNLGGQRCRSLHADGANLGGGVVTVTSSCTGAGVVGLPPATAALPGGAVFPALLVPPTTGLTRYPWTCTINDAGATPGPLGVVDYVAICRLNV